MLPRGLHRSKAVSNENSFVIQKLSYKKLHFPLILVSLFRFGDEADVLQLIDGSILFYRFELKHYFWVKFVEFDCHSASNFSLLVEVTAALREP